MKNIYRIVSVEGWDFEAQVKFWWFPLMWFEMSDSGSNWFRTVDEAETFIVNKIKQSKRKRFVKYVETN